MLSIFTIIRAGGEDSAFSNASIIHHLCEQVSHLQGRKREGSSAETSDEQKQMHAKNNEVATLKDQLQAEVCPKYSASGDTLHDACTGRPRPKAVPFSDFGYMYRVRIL